MRRRLPRRVESQGAHRGEAPRRQGTYRLASLIGRHTLPSSQSRPSNANARSACFRRFRLQGAGLHLPHFGGIGSPLASMSQLGVSWTSSTLRRRAMVTPASHRTVANADRALRALAARVVTLAQGRRLRRPARRGPQLDARERPRTGRRHRRSAGPAGSGRLSLVAGDGRSGRRTGSRTSRGATLPTSPCVRAARNLERDPGRPGQGEELRGPRNPRSDRTIRFDRRKGATRNECITLRR